MRGLVDVYGSWIEALQDRRLPDRHRPPRERPLLLPAAPRRSGPRLRRAGVEDFTVFGEVFDARHPRALLPSCRVRGLPSLLDFPLEDQLVGLCVGRARLKGIVSVLRGTTTTSSSETGQSYTPPTFLGNHDMGRVGLLLRQHSGDDATLLRRDLLAHSLLYLLRGAPVVYYGDEVGMMGSGGDKLAREDMFPTRVADWRTERRVGAAPMRGVVVHVRDHPVELLLEKLAALRDAHPALATGPSAVRLASGPLLVVSRFDLATRHEYVTAFNAGMGRTTVTVQTATPDSAWSTLLGEQGAARSTSAGKLGSPSPR